MTDRERYHARKECGLCVDCGKPIDGGSSLVRCRDCLDIRNRFAMAKKHKHDSDIGMGSEKVETKKRRKAAETIESKCLYCEWGSLAGDVIFCPFREGSCLKNNQVFKNARNGGSAKYAMHEEARDNGNP